MLLRRLAQLLGSSHDGVLWRYLRRVVGYCLVQGATFTLVVPIIRALLEQHLAQAALWLVPLTLGTAATGYLHYHAALGGFQVASTLLSTLRHRIGEHVGTLPLGWFTRDNTSRLGMLTSQGVMEILGLPAHQLTPLIRAILTPSVVVVATLFFDWRVALAAAALFPLVALIYWWAGTLGRAADRAVHRAGAQACDRMVEFAQNQPVLRSFGRSAQGYRQFDEALVMQHRAGRRQLWLVLPPLLANAWLGQLSVLLLMAGIATLVLSGGDAQQDTTLLALLVLINRVIDPLSEVASYGAGIRMAAAQMTAVEQVLAQSPLPQPPPGSPVITPRSADITLHDVTFGYQPGVPVLKNITLTLPANTMTAIVGASGAGKSTLMQLIARFFDPDSGSVTIGGVDVKALHPTQQQRMIAQVFQHTYLFSGTLRDNLLMGKPNASEAMLLQAIRLARLESVVARLPQGLDSPVGEGGGRLSGGERQRVALARALLKQAPILLLDEATGALDSENQSAIAQGLHRLRGRCTLLVIAHQLATIQHADCIVVLDRQGIVEQGTHQQLLANNGRYAALWRARTHAEGWRIASANDDVERNNSHV